MQLTETYDVFNKILSLLTTKKILYKVTEHTPVFTSEEAAKIRGVAAEFGAKALVLKAETLTVLCVVPGDKKLDSKKVKSLLGSKSLRFATEGEVEVLCTGVKIGSVPPFGSIFGLKTIFDRSFDRLGEVTFNPGRHEKTIWMACQDLLACEQPQLAEISC